MVSMGNKYMRLRVAGSDEQIIDKIQKANYGEQDFSHFRRYGVFVDLFNCTLHILNFNKVLKLKNVGEKTSKAED